MKKALRGTRFARVTPHDLRHAHGSALLHAGSSVAHAAARLRDTQETVWPVYSHQLKGDEDEGARIADALSVAKSGKTRMVPVIPVYKSLNVEQKLAEG